jgi:hypothetical protein
VPTLTTLLHETKKPKLRNKHMIQFRRLSGAVVIGELRSMLADLVRNDLKAFPSSERSSDLHRNVVIQFVVGSLMSVITWSLDERSKLSPAEGNAIFERLTLPEI